MRKTIEGIVQKGSQQAGKTFFLPTANLHQEDADMETGVFFATGTTQEKTYHGLCFIGKASLLEEKPDRLEIHLFDYDGPSLYGQKIKVTLIEKLREPIEFTSKEEAREIIEKDVQQAKRYFQS